MRTVEATTSTNRRDLGLVEMWLSGLRRPPAKGLSGSFASSNLVISSNSSTINRCGAAVAHPVWGRRVAGSIPATYINETVVQLVELSVEARSASVRPGAVSPYPILLIARSPADNRETVEHNHDWVPSQTRLIGKSTILYIVSPRLGRNSGSNPESGKYVLVGEWLKPRSCNLRLSKARSFESNQAHQYARLAKKVRRLPANQTCGSAHLPSRSILPISVMEARAPLKRIA